MKTTAAPSSSKRWIAFSLSAFLLPGLGQFHLGFRKTGWTMVLLSLSTAIFIFGKFMMGVFQVMDRAHYLRPPRLEVLKTLLEALRVESSWMIAGAILLFLIWVWGIWDVLAKTRDLKLSNHSLGHYFFFLLK